MYSEPWCVEMFSKNLQNKDFPNSRVAILGEIIDFLWVGQYDADSLARRIP